MKRDRSPLRPPPRDARNMRTDSSVSDDTAMFQRMVFMMIQNRVYLHRCLYIHPDAFAIAPYFNKTVAKNAVQPSGGALTTACAPMAALIPPARCPRPPLGSSFLDIRSATGRATPSTEAPGWKGQIMRNGPDAKCPPGAAGALRPGQAPVTCAGARSRKPLRRMVCSCVVRPPTRRARRRAPRGVAHQSALMSAALITSAHFLASVAIVSAICCGLLPSTLKPCPDSRCAFSFSAAMMAWYSVCTMADGAPVGITKPYQVSEL